MGQIENFILNPSFVIPVLYCSALLNIILLLILARIMGPLRKALSALYVIHPPSLKGLSSSYKKELEESSKNKEIKDSQDKQPINTQDLF